MDLGSAVLSAELAVELLHGVGIKTRLVSAAFVEGIFAAVISAAAGAPLEIVARDAEDALMAKAAQLGQTQTSTDAVAAPISRSPPSSRRRRSSIRMASTRDLRRSSSATLPHSMREVIIATDTCAASLSPQSHRADVAGYSRPAT